MGNKKLSKKSPLRKPPPSPPSPPSSSPPMPPRPAPSRNHVLEAVIPEAEQGSLAPVSIHPVLESETADVSTGEKRASRPDTQDNAGLPLKAAVGSKELAIPATSQPMTERKSDAGEGSTPQPGSSWVDMVKGPKIHLKKSGTPFLLDSGEPCVCIPNNVIERNRKEWDCFILGQFYSPPPSQGVVHNVVNGIWSRIHRDVAVSKMEGNSFLFRIPNPATRSRVLTQRLWQIDGQTMFVAKWEPGVVPNKPELSSAPIWLELRNVPLQFFSAEGLEPIASMVGEPKFLHPATANKTNLEVARVFTVIDPRKALPEAVNVKFESGEIKRITVSSPWMPPVCAHCNEVGHSIRHCRLAPITCSNCNSRSHALDKCTRGSKEGVKKSSKQAGNEIVARLERNLTHKDTGTSEVQSLSSDSQGEQFKLQRSVKELAGVGNPMEPEVTQTSSSSDASGNKSVPEVGTSKSGRKGVVQASSKKDLRLKFKEKISEECTAIAESEEESSDVSTSDFDQGEYLTVLSKRQRKKTRGKGLQHLV